MTRHAAPRAARSITFRITVLDGVPPFSYLVESLPCLLVALLGSLAVPVRGLLTVLWHTLPKVVHALKVELRPRVARSAPAVPRHRLSVILRDFLAFVVQVRQRSDCPLITLFGCFAIPIDSQAIILGNTIALFVQISQQDLTRDIALF